MYVCTPHLLYSSVDGPLGYFHILKIVNNASMNTGMHVSVWVSIFFRQDQHYNLTTCIAYFLEHGGLLAVWISLHNGDIKWEEITRKENCIFLVIANGNSVIDGLKSFNFVDIPYHKAFLKYTYKVIQIKQNLNQFWRGL